MRIKEVILIVRHLNLINMIDLKISFMEEDSRYEYYGVTVDDPNYKNLDGGHFVHFYFWYEEGCTMRKFNPY